MNIVKTKFDSATGLFNVTVNGNVELDNATLNETLNFLDSLLEMQVISLKRHKELCRGVKQSY